MSKEHDYEAIIIGGSYAGLSAAMALGRSLRKTLVIDAGQACNRQTPHSQNFLTQDGVAPALIAQRGKEQVARYDTITFLDDFATEGRSVEQGFEISTKAGRTFLGKRLIFATGVKDIMPEIPGFADCWGISVIHCPYCHGYEFNGQKTGVMANGERAFHLTGLVNNLTDDLTILTNGPAEFSSEQRDQLAQHNIPIVETAIAAVEHQAGQLEAIRFQNGESLPFSAVYGSVPFTQQSGIPASLGCAIDEYGLLEVDEFQRTTVEGVYACGDNSTPFRSVAKAVAGGNAAGAVVNMSLLRF